MLVSVKGSFSLSLLLLHLCKLVVFAVLIGSASEQSSALFAADCCRFMEILLSVYGE